MNGEEITHHISSVTVERQVGERTRIGLNGGEPVVRDNVRVEMEQGGARYVIDEQRLQDAEPLPRLSTGAPRNPLSDRADWRNYWPREAESASERLDALVSDWVAEHMPEMPPLTPFQRHLLDGIVTHEPRGIVSAVAPGTEAPVDILGDMRRFCERMMEPDFDVVARPEIARRIPAMPGVAVHESAVVPDGHAYVINSAALREYRAAMLSNMSIGFSVEPPMRFDEDVYRFRVTARMMPLPGCGRFSVFGDVYSYCREHAPIPQHLRNATYRHSVRAGYRPSSSSPRRRSLNKAYRRRSLSRRRRNR